MITFTDIIDRARPEPDMLPDETIRERLHGIGVDLAPHVIRDWRLRKSIPPEYWEDAVSIGLCTLPELAAAAKVKAAERRSRQDEQASAA